MLLLHLSSLTSAFYTNCAYELQNAIDDKLDKKQWPFVSEPAPINTTQTTIRCVMSDFYYE